MNNSEGSVSSIATKKTGLGSKSANISTSQVKIKFGQDDFSIWNRSSNNLNHAHKFTFDQF
jgi:hypothetical protein